METHNEKSVKKLQIEERGWPPLKPHFGEIYDESEMEAFLSRFSHQNQQFLSPCCNNNHLWDVNHGGGDISLQQRESINNHNHHIEKQRRGLDNYLPPWNNQGPTTKPTAYPSPQPPPPLPPSAQSYFPYLSSWEASQSLHAAGVLGGEEDPLSNLSFADLLAIKDSGMPNPGWNSNHPVYNSSSMFFNHNNLQRFNPQIADFVAGEMQNGGSLHQYQSVCNSNSPLTNTNATISNFAPATPDSRWRIDSNAGSGNTPLGACNQVPEQNEFQEQDVGSEMINLQNVVDVVPNTDSSSSDKVSMAVENHDPEKGGDQVIDLNKTPQRKPRRRRYQPKVLSEKKPRKTPKPKTPKPTETSQVKRKYVRKNKVDANTTPTTPPREGTETEETKPTEVNEVGDDTKPAEAAAKSCRKSLNFDLNGQAGESNISHMSSRDAYAEAQGKCDAERNQHSDTGNHRQGVELVVQASRGGIAYDLNCSHNQELENYLPTKDYMNNSQHNPNILSKRKENMDNAEILSRSDASHPAQSPNSSPYASSSERKNRRGSKRSNPGIEDVDAGSVGPTLCTFLPPNHQFTDGTANIGEHQNSILPETCKKKKTEKAQRSQVPNASFSVPPGDLNQVASAQNHPRVDPSASKYYCCNPALLGIDAATNNNHTDVLMESIKSGVELTNSWADLARLKKKRSKGTTHVHDLAQLMGITSVLPAKPGPKGPRKKKIDVLENSYTEGPETSSIANPGSKRRSKKQNSEDNQLGLVLYKSDRSAKKPTGSIRSLSWARSTNSIEEITERMKQLDISKESCNTKLKERIQKELLRQNALQEHKALVPYRARKKEQNALVVYGRDGTMVPFDDRFDPVRKRRQRAKVDLDDETTKVWELLLENIENTGIDGTDEDKAKWWENERSVFRGRVDSFIARMRLVQGDRRFTPWKGSVLDSVIGVFLTQNVSDHLSSSAFMSMAAHFPLKSEGSESTLSEESTTALVGEPDVCVIEPEESISWNEKTINQQIFSHNSKNFHDIDHSEEKEVVNSKELTGRITGSVSPKNCSCESSQKNPSSIVSYENSHTTTSILGDDRAKDDATSSQQSVIPSQNSTNSPNPHTVGMISIFSESESRTQRLTTSSQSNYLDCSTSFLGLLKMAESPFLHESYNQAQQDSLEFMSRVTNCFLEAQGIGSSNYLLNPNYQFSKGFEMLGVDSHSHNTSRKDENSTPTEQSILTTELTMQHLTQDNSLYSIRGPFTENMTSCYVLDGEKMVMHSESVKEPSETYASSPNEQTSSTWKCTNLSQANADVTKGTTKLKRTSYDRKEVEQLSAQTYASGGISEMMNANASKSRTGKAGKGKNNAFDWDSLRRDVQPNGQRKERTTNTRDSLDWEAVRHADVSEIAEVIKERGMNNMLAARIKDLLDRLVKEHGSVDMEWLRDIPPDKAKEYLLSFRGLGLKSVECVRLLTLHHLAFPVDTNVGRIAVRLGWVPLQPLPESLQLHLLELYPILESIQKYLWPRLCRLDQKTLYELHYHLITFGKVFCTKRQPNCNACPLRGECRHFASAFASARFALPGPEERSIMSSGASSSRNASSQASSNLLPLPPALNNEYSQNNLGCANGVSTIKASPSSLALPLPQTISHLERLSGTTNCEPIVEVPASPEPELEQTICDIEDTFYEDPDEIPTITLNMQEFSQTLQNYIHTGESNALVALTPAAASIPTPKLKNISRLRTEHHVYELPDTHPLLKGLDKREPDDPCSYLLAIWTPGETADSIQPPERRCNSEDPSTLCNEETCSYCNSLREVNSQIVRGTLLIPCRTAMRGSFPLNGTYFQVNEVFADHDSSLNPIAVPRSWLWNLPRRTVYFGTSIPTIFKGLTTEDIQHCFWRGFVCVRGFDQKSRAPRPLMARLHFPASKMQRGAKGRAYDE